MRRSAVPGWHRIDTRPRAALWDLAVGYEPENGAGQFTLEAGVFSFTATDGKTYAQLMLNEQIAGVAGALRLDVRIRPVSGDSSPAVYATLFDNTQGALDTHTAVGVIASVGGDVGTAALGGFGTSNTGVPTDFSDWQTVTAAVTAAAVGFGPAPLGVISGDGNTYDAGDSDRLTVVANAGATGDVLEVRNIEAWVLNLPF